MARPQVKTLEQIETELDQPTDKRTEEKKFVVGRNPAGLYTISFTAGGEVPDVLKGSFTSYHRANAAIEQHLATK